jgi:cytochrome c oxidase subunit 2
VAGTAAIGSYGPDLTHFASRETLGSGVAPNTAANLRMWIQDPATFKPGSKMPAMGLSDQDQAAVTTYLETLH